MNETKTVQIERAAAEDYLEPVSSTGEIRVLENFELVLAGGGEGEVTWPR